MKKKILILATFFSVKACAILSPTAQAAVEIQRIFSSEEIQHAFGGADFITSCEKVDGGYIVKSDDSQLHVKVVYEPTKRIGPQLFHLEFGNIENLNQ